MKISVIIPVYNSSNSIVDVLLSIIKQTFPANELIIIDDKSADDSVVKIKELIKTEIFKGIEIKIVENEINLGPGYSRNIGISLAKNKVIAFCDADDVWRNDKLEIQTRYLDTYPIVGSNYKVFKDRGEFKSVDLSGIFEFKHFLKNNYLATSTVIMDLNKFTLEDARFENIIHEDYYLWLKLLKKYNFKIIVLNEFLMNYNRGNLSYSSGLLNKIKATYNVFFLISNHPLRSFFFTVRKIVYSFSRYI